MTRLNSLDIFRGLTVALMIIVNSPGSRVSYAWLEHSPWHGCTLADLVFPFFLVALGLSIAFGYEGARDKRVPVSALAPKILLKTALFCSIGLALNAFPPPIDWHYFRPFGVMQRIGLCYLVTSFLYLTTTIRSQLVIVGGLLVSYWLLLTELSVPGFGLNVLTPEGNLTAFIDRAMLGATHLYGKVYDPEGLLSTLPAIATSLMGALVGQSLLRNPSHQHKLRVLCLTSGFALGVGWVWGLSFPINKALWTSSYALWTLGFALLALLVVYWLVEIKGKTGWAKPFTLLGSNALLAYVLHVAIIKLLFSTHVRSINGDTLPTQRWLCRQLFGHYSEKTASLLYAISYFLFCLALIWFIAKVRVYYQAKQTLAELSS